MISGKEIAMTKTKRVRVDYRPLWHRELAGLITSRDIEAFGLRNAHRGRAMDAHKRRPRVGRK